MTLESAPTRRRWFVQRLVTRNRTSWLIVHQG
jgi:hypothetical protein